MWITPIMFPKRKRSLNEEGRVFNEEWEVQYFLVPNKDNMLQQVSKPHLVSFQLISRLFSNTVSLICSRMRLKCFCFLYKFEFNYWKTQTERDRIC